MDPLERLENDYQLAREKGARPELLVKMEDQLSRLRLRNIPEPKIIETEDIFFPQDEFDDRIFQKEMDFGSNSINLTRSESDYSSEFDL